MISRRTVIDLRSLCLASFLGLAVAAPVTATENSPATPCADCALCLQELTESFANRGWLGLQLHTDHRGRGLGIVEVTAGGPAEAAGLRMGDLIVSFDGESTAGLEMAGLSKLITGLEPRQEVELVVQDRTGARREVTVRARVMPQDVMVRAIGLHVLLHSDREAQGEYFEGPPGP